MNTPTIDILAEQLNRLERAHDCLQRQSRVWKRVAVGVLVGAVALAAAGAAGQRPAS